MTFLGKNGVYIRYQAGPKKDQITDIYATYMQTYFNHFLVY